MGSILSAVVSLFAFRFRSRASLEIELIAVRHQLAVLRRQRPGRPQLSSLDRLLWVWLYRIWPQVIDAIGIAKTSGFTGAGDHAVRDDPRSAQKSVL
jgi:putative transposase